MAPEGASRGRPAGDAERDADLYHRAVGGDEGAVRLLIERHHRELVRYCRSKTSDDAAAEDAVSDAWMRFFRHLAEVKAQPETALRSPGSLRFWLMKTAVNYLHSGMRRQIRSDRREQQVGAEALRESHDDPVDAVVVDRLDTEEMRAEVRAAFHRLSEACRDLLALLLQDPPLSYQEVADLVGRPVGAIGPTRQRCLRQLRVNLGAPG